MIDLILGGNKSGKSDFALELLLQSPPPWNFIATGKSRDQAFRDQIQTHRQGRDARIAVHEVDADLTRGIGMLSDHAGSTVVDSLDFWMFSVAERFTEQADRRRVTGEFVEAIAGWSGGRLILVSTEMGLGPLAFDGEIRAFARDLGSLNREIARASTSVYLVVAGLPQKLK